MTPAEQRAFQEMRELPIEDDSDDWIMLPDILDGSVLLDLSHEGGEFDGLKEEYRKRYGYTTRLQVRIFSHILSQQYETCRSSYPSRSDRAAK